MAELHTDLPTRYRGEHQLALALKDFPDPQLHLWFALNFLDGVRDVDWLLWHEAVGVFLIEVKAVPVEKVELFDHRRCKIHGREEGKSPALQAYEARESLNQYLKGRVSWIPFIVSSACWPLISRRRWREYWEDPDLGKDYSCKMVFQEDLRDPEALRDRLTFVYWNPPCRGAPRLPFRHSPDLLEDFRRALAPVARPRRLPADLDGIARVEDVVAIRQAGVEEAGPEWSLRRAFRLIDDLADYYGRSQAEPARLGEWERHVEALLRLVNLLEEAGALAADDPATWPALQRIEGRLSETVEEVRSLGPLCKSLGAQVERQAQEVQRRCREVESELRTFLDAARAIPNGNPETRRALEKFEGIRSRIVADLSARPSYRQLADRFRTGWANFVRLRNTLAVQVRYRPTLKHLDRMSLNDEQEGLVAAEHPGHFRVQGASGSGKTVVLLHRALRLARDNPAAEVRVFTINRSLAEHLRETLLAFQGPLPGNLHVGAFYDFLHGCLALFERRDRYRLVDDRSGERIAVSWHDFFRHRANAFAQALGRQLADSIRDRYGLKVDASHYLREEMVYIRSMARRGERRGYLDSTRAERAIRFGVRQRETCLKILDAWEEWLEAGDLCDIDGLTSHAAELFWDEGRLAAVRAAFPTDYVLVDGVQDFSTLEMAVLRRLVPDPEAANAFFFAGDLNQKVFPKHHLTTRAGFNFRGRAKVLTRNYRNTRQILRAAYHVAAAYPPRSEEDFQALPPELSPFEGGRPVALRCKGKDHAAQVLALVRLRKDSRVAVVSDNEKLLARVREGARSLGLRCFELFRNEDIDRWRDQQGDSLSAHLVVSRLEAVKGFEFDTVIACDLSEGVTPRPGTPAQEYWREAAVVYSALTRARDELIVTFTGKPSPFLTCMGEDLDTIEAAAEVPEGIIPDGHAG